MLEDFLMTLQTVKLNGRFRMGGVCCSFAPGLSIFAEEYSKLESVLG